MIARKVLSYNEFISYEFESIYHPVGEILNIEGPSIQISH